MADPNLHNEKIKDQDGGESRGDKQSGREPGRTPGSAEGDRDTVEESLRDHKKKGDL